MYSYCWFYKPCFSAIFVYLCWLNMSICVQLYSVMLLPLLPLLHWQISQRTKQLILTDCKSSIDYSPLRHLLPHAPIIRALVRVRLQVNFASILNLWLNWDWRRVINMANIVKHKPMFLCSLLPQPTTTAGFCKQRTVKGYQS